MANIIHKNSTTSEDLDKAPRLSISKDIWILSSDTDTMYILKHCGGNGAYNNHNCFNPHLFRPETMLWSVAQPWEVLPNISG